MFIFLTGCVLDLFLKSREKESVFSVFDSMLKLSYNLKSLSCSFKLNFKSNYIMYLKFVIALFLCPTFFVQVSKRKSLFRSCFGSGSSLNFHHSFNHK